MSNYTQEAVREEQFGFEQGMGSTYAMLVRHADDITMIATPKEEIYHIGKTSKYLEKTVTVFTRNKKKTLCRTIKQPILWHIYHVHAQASVCHCPITLVLHNDTRGPHLVQPAVCSGFMILVWSVIKLTGGIRCVGALDSCISYLRDTT